MATGAGGQGRDGGDNLQTAVHLLPTPTARDFKDSLGQNVDRRPIGDDSLPVRVIRMLPTPTSRDGTKQSANPETSARRRAKGQQLGLIGTVNLLGR